MNTIYKSRMQREFSQRIGFSVSITRGMKEGDIDERRGDRMDITNDSMNFFNLHDLVDCSALMIAKHITSASAMREELTKSWVHEPWRSVVNPVPVKIQANPACSVNSLFYVTSFLHIVLVSRVVAWIMFFVGSVKILLILYPECCALIHFPANLRALVATSVEIEELASKMRELLASQIDQQIHMRMFLEILVGGRQSLSLKRVNTFSNSSSVAMWTTRWRRIDFQTPIENGQVKNVCIVVSLSWHLVHNISVWMPLFCKLSPKENVTCMIDYRNTFIFGKKCLLSRRLLSAELCSEETRVIDGFH